MGEIKFIKNWKGPWKKVLIVVACLVIVMAVAMFAMTHMQGDEKVEFSVLSDEDFPQDMVSQVIPEYRGLERALACMVEDKVYVLVTRGEKPTSGFDVNIEKMVVEEKDGMTNLAIYTSFTDPEPGVALTQILTYPMKVAETGLTKLPDQIELRVQYK